MLYVRRPTSSPWAVWNPCKMNKALKNKNILLTCTTTELSILLTSCLTAIKNQVIKYCTTVYERNGKHDFGLLNIQVRLIINKNLKVF